MDIIANYGDLCGEAPIWDDTTANLFWVDCVGLKAYRYDARTRSPQIIKENLEINGWALHKSGGFVISNNSGVWHWDGADSLTPIINEVDGSLCQLNDSVADPAGRFLAGSCFYNPSGEYQLGKLIIVNLDGSAKILDEGFHLANGLSFSPDGARLYFSDSVARVIYAYDYDVKEGAVRNRRVFVRVPDTEGLPDGLTVDAEGFVWSAQWYGGQIVRYDPEGKVERRITVPAKQTSSLTFGGDKLTDIFITSAAKSEPMPVMPADYDPVDGYFGGALYSLKTDIQGKADYRCAITLS